MTKALKLPSQYIQGEGELANIGKHIKKIGTKFLVLLTDNSRKRFGSVLEQSFAENELSFVYESFGGECSLPEVNKVTEAAKAQGCDCIIAVGGGKTIDTGKGAATYLGSPCVIVPTIASNDAPCSGLSVVYNEEGVVCKVIYSKRNPDVVLVDTAIIASAPARFFAAGIGDALATWYEARACAASGSRNFCRALDTDTALVMAETSKNLLFRYGKEAYESVKEGRSNEAVEHTLEATILLSGVGFESGGLAAAHAINDGFAFVPSAHGAMHGEKVAFGLLCQLILEKVPAEELEEVIRFCMSVDLPVCLADLGVENIVEEELRAVAKAACVKTQSTKNLPFPVSEEDVYQAILAADAAGKKMKQ